MKKKVLLMMCLVALTMSGKGLKGAELYGSGNFNGKGLGYGIGVEYNKSIKKIKKVDLSAGFGLKYDSFDNGDKTEYASKVSTMPIYLNGKMTYSNYYVRTSLGYTNPLKTQESILNDLKGGAYFGIGLGMEKNSYLVELNYDIANYEGDYTSALLTYNDKIKYGKASIIVGYKFK